jgi:DNA polymerase III delta prime subunit
MKKENANPEVQENGLMVQEENGLMSVQNLGSFYSVKAETKADKVKLFNAINNPDFRLADFINMKIKIKDVVVEIVELEQTDDEDKPKVDIDGEVIKQKAPRVVLIDDKGKSYQCVSVGIFSALKKMIALFGTPTWEEPIEIMVKQVSKKERKMLTIELV